MFYGRLYEFLSASWPKEIQVARSEFEDAAKRAGLKIQNKGDRGPAPLVSDRAEFAVIEARNIPKYIEMKEKISLYWGSPDLEGGVAVWKPYLKGWVSCRCSENIEKNVLRELGAFAFELELPERVVQLPKPDWLEVYAQGDCYASIERQYVFLSEAKKLVDDFISELESSIA